MGNKKVAKAGVGYIVGNYLLKGFSFITVPIFARLLTVSDFGVFSIFVTYEGIFSIIVGMTIHSSLKNALYKYTDGDDAEIDYYSYASNTILFILFSGAIWLIVFSIFHKQLAGLLDMDAIAMLMVVLFSISSALLLCFNADRGLRYEYISYLKVAAFNAIVNFLLSLALIFTVFQDDRALARIIGTTAPMVIIGCIIVFLFLHRAKPKGVIRSLAWGVRYSLPIVPHGLSQIILNQFDRIMIKSMINYNKAGQYSFAYSIYSILAVTFTSLEAVWTPWFYEQMNKENYDQIRSASNHFAVYICIFCVLVMLGSPELVWILGGSKYSESVYSVLPIVAGGYYMFLYYFPAGVEYYYEKTYYVAIGSFFAALINIALNLYFIPRYGYVSAAYTTLVSYGLYFLFHYLIAYRVFGKMLFSTKVMFGCGAAIIGMMFVARAILRYVIIRWGMILIIMAGTLFSVEKNYGLRNLTKKLRK